MRALVTPRRRLAVAALLLVFSLCAVYANGLGGPFVMDDARGIERNESIRSLLPLSGVLHPPLGTPLAARPVPNLTLAIDYAIGGLDPAGFRRTNLVLHALAALLILGSLRRLLRSQGVSPWIRRHADSLAFFSAWIWSLHPLTAEVVLYAVQRTEACVAVFYLAVVYAAIRASESPRPARWVAIAVVACALGMASKAVMATAPAMVLWLDRAFLAGSLRTALQRRKTLYLGLLATYPLLFWLQTNSPRSDSVRGPSLDYLLLQSEIVLEYLGRALWPVGFVPDYGFLQPDQVTWAWLPALLLLLALCLVLQRTHPRIGFVGAWVFGVLAPSSSLVTIHTEIGAERRMYLPLAGIVALVVVAAYALGRRISQARLSLPPAHAQLLAGAAGVVTVAALAIQTHARREEFASVRAFWEHAALRRPRSGRAHYNLGLELEKLGETRDAADSLRTAIRVAPDPYDTHDVHGQAGLLFMAAGDTASALAHLQRAVELRPEHVEARLNLAGLLVTMGRPGQALVHLEHAVRLAPDHAAARGNLGLLLGMQGRFVDAAAQLRAAVELAPRDALARVRLASALAQAGDRQSALSHVQAALRLEPRHGPALKLQAHLKQDAAAARGL